VPGCEGAEFATTRLKLYIKLDLGGVIPSRIVTMNASKFFNDYVVMRKMFNKDYEIDLLSRSKVTKCINKHNSDKYSLAEKADIEKGKRLMRAFQDSDSHTLIDVGNTSATINCVAAQIRGKTWCKLRTTVRVGGKEGERAKRASLDEDENTRDESREMATDGFIHY